MQPVVHAKVVVIGSIGVGKSSLTIRYVHNQFHQNLDSTLGAVYFEKIHPLENRKVKFEFWDTAGQEKYKAIARIYYKDCRVALVVYDINQRSSFESLKMWVEQLKANGPAEVLIVVVGNKQDLLEKDEDVPYAEAQDYALSIGAILKYTSAKDGKGVQELFQEIAVTVVESDTQTHSKGATIKSSKSKKKTSCC